MAMLIGNQHRPEVEHAHDGKDGNDGIEDAEVKPLAGVGSLGRRRHEAENDGLPAVVNFVEIGVVEMSEAPSLWQSTC